MLLDCFNYGRDFDLTHMTVLRCSPQFFNFVGLPLFSAFCHVFPSATPMLLDAKANHAL